YGMARLDKALNASRVKQKGSHSARAVKTYHSANSAAWRIHDLRRTAATGMAELGVLPHIVEAVLNHVSGHKGRVAGIYNRARYAGEMREALQRWADHVERICDK